MESPSSSGRGPGEQSLLQELERRNRLLEAVRAMVEASDDDDPSVLVPRLLRILCAATSSDSAGLYRADPGSKSLVLVGVTEDVPAWFAEKYRTVPLEATLNGLVSNDKRPIRLSTEDLPPASRDDAKAIGTLQTVVLPLFVKDHVAGTVNVGRRHPLPYSEEDLSSLSVLCGQISLQLERARLRQDALRRVEELSLINEVGGLISQQLDLERVFDTAMRHVCRVVDIAEAYLLLVDEREQRLSFVASNAPRSPPPSHIALDQRSIAGLAFSTQKCIAIPDLAKDPRSSNALKAHFGHRRLLAVPLISQGKSIGVMVLGDAQARPFAEGEPDRAVAVANQLASAIHNARLFADLKASYEELRRTQETLVRRERLAALGELAAVVAHEVRNPLGVIFNSLASLHRMAMGEEPRLLMRIMAEESERLNRMVGDLLDFARPRKPELAPTCIAELVRGAIESARRATALPGIEVRLQLPEGLPLVHIDAQQMRQAILNLILNSVQAMPQGGELVVRAQLEPDPEAPAVRLEISDGGPGIPAAEVDRVFQPFFTTKASGTGLGLAIVKSIVEAHQVDLQVRSEGRGATFSLVLPVAGQLHRRGSAATR